MGWSGYNPLGLYAGLEVLVDAHGGEREERGERLFREFCTDLQAAITKVVRDPKYAQPDALRISYETEREWVTNEESE